MEVNYYFLSSLKCEETELNGLMQDKIGSLEKKSVLVLLSHSPVVWKGYVEYPSRSQFSFMPQDLNNRMHLGFFQAHMMNLKVCPEHGEVKVAQNCLYRMQ